MIRGKAAAWLAAGVTVFATATTGAVAPAHAATAYRLSVSTHSNRAHAVSLAGKTLHGNVYIYATPSSGALRVKFYLDDPKRRHQPMHVETAAPYDLLGGSPAHPKAFKTTGLSNGRHTLTIAVDQPNNQKSLYTASFSVKNMPPKPSAVHAKAGTDKVTVTWHMGSGSTTGFYVYRSTHAKVSLSHSVSGRLKSSGRTFVDTHVQAGVRYYYVVQAVGTGGARTNSARVRSGTVKAVSLGLTRISGVGGDGQVRLSWAVHGVPSQIRIYRGTPTIDLTKPLAKLPGSARTWVDTQNVVDGTTYRYVVQALIGSRRSQSPHYAVTPVAAPHTMAAVGGADGVSVSWATAGAGVTAFAIFRSPTTPVALTSPLTTTVAASARSWTDVTATVGTTYYYVVRALSLNGHAEGSTVDGATRVAAPTGVVTTSGDGTVTVSWNANGLGVTGYQVYRDDNPVSGLLTPSVGSLSENALANGETFQYVVRAFSTGGQADSAPQPATPIASPVLATPSVDDDGIVTLNWSLSNEPTVTGYRIYRDTSGSVSTTGVAYASVDANTDSWTDPDTTDGVAYVYVVQAFYSRGQANSNMVATRPEPVAPAPVADLAAAPLEGIVLLTWGTVDPRTTSLEIYRSDTPDELGDLVLPPLAPTVEGYTDGLPQGLPDGTYYYTVRAIDGGGFNDATVNVTVATDPVPVGP
jgi:hypothetical protein